MRTLHASSISTAALAVLAVFAGCGDNDDPPAEPDAMPRCAVPPKPLPPGPLTDVAAYLPATCAEGGLEGLPGRWFARDPAENFLYSYPGFDGSCADGFHQAGTPLVDDDDASDGFTFHTWSDGTRFFNQFYGEFMGFQFGRTQAACLDARGDLHFAIVRFDTDQGAVVFPMEGARFAAKEPEPARGLALEDEMFLRADGTPIEAYNLVLEGDLAYVVGPWGLDIIDVSDPTALVHVGYLDGLWNDIKVTTRGNRTIAWVSPLFGGESTRGIDVTDPTDPQFAVELPEYSHSVFVRDDGPRTLLYLATYTAEVPVYDVSNPLQPTRLGAAPVTGASDGVHDLFADGDLLYVNYTTAGLVAVDVSAGLDAAVERGRVVTPYSHASWAATIGGRRIVIHGDEGMSPDGGALLRVLDATPGPTFMSELSRYATRPEVGIHNILIEGTKAYIAYYQDGVRVVELADPTRPVEVAHFHTWDAATAGGEPFEGALGLRYRGGRIYVADSLRGLMVLREVP